MKTRKMKTIKKVIAIIVTIAILFGITSTFAMAADPTVVCLDVSGKDLRITSTGWYVDDGSETSFTGDYFLYGTGAKSVSVDSGEHNITVHDLTIKAPEWWSAFRANKDTTVNLTAVGINQFIAYNHAGITGEGTVNLTVADNSSILLDRSYNQSNSDYSVAYTTIFSVAPGTSADSVNMTNDEWRKTELKITKGTPAAHSLSYTGNENGHSPSCPTCNVNYGVYTSHTDEGYIATATGHKSGCIACGYSTADEVPHSMIYTGTKDGHGQICSVCDYYDATILNEHTPVFTSNDRYSHVEQCSDCSFVIATETHNWDYSIIEGEGADEYHNEECVDCGYTTTDSHDLWYHEKGDGHILTCDYCDYTDGVISPHSDAYYDWIDNKSCAQFCLECDAQLGKSVPHDMSKYYSYDETHCIALCNNCGFYDSDNPTLVEHSYTGPYEILSSEYCTQICIYCGKPDYDNIVTHVADKPITVKPDGNAAGYTATYCKNCNFLVNKTYAANTIVVDVSNIYGDSWESSGIILYVDGVPVEFIRYRASSSEYTESYGINYDKNKSYVFKYIPDYYSDDASVEIRLLGEDEATSVLFNESNLEDYDMLETILQINTADYSGVDEALSNVPETFEEYTPASVKALVTAIKGVKRMLPSGKQTEVNAMATAINNAVNGLELNPNGVKIGHGVINAKYNVVGIHVDSEYSGYEICDANNNYKWYDYDGDYVIIDTADKENSNEAYSDSYIDVYSGKVNIDIVNYYITSTQYTPIGIWDNSDVTLNLYGANASVSTGYVAGVTVEETAKLTIEDKGGSLIAYGSDDCAGIGSASNDEAGTITINGGSIFAFSEGDGAGIGGGYEAGFNTITINDGTIWAECLSDDGAGIGVGDDGNGGDIIINGGNITALSVDDDGAGIGGADKGSVDSITINGGKIVAGSDDAAAIGSGQDSDSTIGIITITGGEISASEWHNPEEALIGKGNSNSHTDENNYITITGGTINTDGSIGISPELALDCNCRCHSDSFFSKFLWSITNFFNKLFGINQTCQCGEVHYKKKI